MADADADVAEIDEDLAAYRARVERLEHLREHMPKWKGDAQAAEDAEVKRLLPIYADAWAGEIKIEDSHEAGLRAVLRAVGKDDET
jgi:hypothetical protein